MPTNNALYFIPESSASGGGVSKSVPLLCIEGYEAADPDAERKDYLLCDFSNNGFAKIGMARFVFTGAETIEADLTSLDTDAGTSVGDTNFAKWNILQFVCDGGSSISVEPGAADGATLDFVELLVRDGKRVVLSSPTGTTIDASHCKISMTSTADGGLWIVVGGE